MRRFLEGFEEGIGRLGVEAVGTDDDGHFELRFGGLELDFTHQFAHLINGDLAGLGFGARPMDIGVRVIVNFTTAGALIAAVHGDAVLFDGIKAVESFGQSARERFEFFHPVARKQISVAEAAASEGALQDLGALLVWKKFERHEK